MEETRQFALKIKPDYISLNSFVPLPGTDIYNEWDGVFGSINPAEYNQLNPQATFLQNISSDDYREKFLSILNDFDKHNEAKKRERDNF
jgi:hypothetical protein